MRGEKYRVCNHPMSKRDRLFSNKDNALKYLNYLNTLKKTEKTEKSTNIKYIQKYGENGFQVVIPNKKRKYFTSKKLSKEDNFDRAKEYLEEIMNNNI